MAGGLSIILFTRLQTFSRFSYFKFISLPRISIYYLKYLLSEPKLLPIYYYILSCSFHHVRQDCRLFVMWTFCKTCPMSSPLPLSVV